MALNARPQRANGARSSGPAASRPSVRRVSVQARSLSDTGKEAMLGGREWLSTILSRFGPATDRAQNITTLEFEKPLLELDKRIKEVRARGRVDSRAL